jgi:phytoene synthase
VRDPAVVLYAYCRRADDAIDFAAEHELEAALRDLRAELDAVFAGGPLSDPIASSFQTLVRARRIPRVYTDELLAGFEMDALGMRYDALAQLLRYCYRVAGTVGLMMCHVLGVRDDRALPHAAHLGVAMQLTNVCRDVLEDWQRGRLYLPGDLLALYGAPRLCDALGTPFPTAAAPAVARTIDALLEIADGFYASADAGMGYLSLRCALAIRTARLVYAEIGAELRRRGCDPCGERAVVSASRKQLLAARAVAATLFDLGARLGPEEPALPRGCIDDPDALLAPPACRHGRHSHARPELGRLP